MIWLTCEVLPDCSNELSYVSGINFFGKSIDTNLFDIHEEQLAGYFVLETSFASIGILVIWRIRK